MDDNHTKAIERLNEIIQSNMASPHFKRFRDSLEITCSKDDDLIEGRIRQMLIDMVFYGLLQPQRAEDMLKDYSLSSVVLSKTPSGESYEPANCADWSLGMCASWIMDRDIEKLKPFWLEYCQLGEIGGATWLSSQSLKRPAL